MSRGYVEYELTTSGRREFVAYSAFLNYRLADGAALAVEQQPAWCPTCDGFVLGEWVPTVAVLEERAAAVRDPKGFWRRFFESIGRSPAEVEAELLRRIEWRRERVGPPRCLTCGSDRIRPLPDGPAFSHPATGEPVAVVGRGFASMEQWGAAFTSEGHALPAIDDAPPGASG